MEFLFTIPLNGFTKIKCMYQVLANVVSKLGPLLALEDTYRLQFLLFKPLFLFSNLFLLFERGKEYIGSRARTKPRTSTDAFNLNE